MALNPTYNKRVLITGGTGFLGSNFVYKFLELGYEVHLLVRSESNFWRIEPILKKIKLHYINLLDAKETERFITILKPQIILHFATYGAYQSKQQDIKLTIDTNLLGTANLVNACSKIKFKCFINTGSSSEYGIKTRPIKETDSLNPVNLYGITKAAASMYCYLIQKNLNLPIVTLRPFAVYGYFEDKDRLIPTIIRACLTNSELKLSNPNYVRDFIFIEDIIDAYLKVIKNIRKLKGEIFNMGSGSQYKVSQLVTLIKRLTLSSIKPHYGNISPAQLEPKKWVADMSKSRNSLDWQPKYDLRVGLRKDIEWFKENIVFYK